MKKQLGDWTNEGSCEASGYDKSCGPGIQMQKRTCVDGNRESEKCTDSDKIQTISCSEAGTSLPECISNQTHTQLY